MSIWAKIGKSCGLNSHSERHSDVARVILYYNSFRKKRGVNYNTKTLRRSPGGRITTAATVEERRTEGLFFVNLKTKSGKTTRKFKQNYIFYLFIYLLV